MLIPYGHSSMRLNLDESTAEIIESDIHSLVRSKSEDDIVKAAMAEPFGGVTLREMARGKRNAVIIISDHTRPVPSRHILPFMLGELREGNPDIDITLLVATGCHRLTFPEELRAKLGDGIFEREKIVVHDCDRNNVAIGTLPSGAQLVIDRVAAETELLVAEGFIEPHFFAGFSGGRKSVLPGICERGTVLGNHCAKFIDDPCASTGVLDGNPIHIDMLAAARLAKLRYIVNVIINDRKEAVAAFAGDPESAHRAGCERLMQYCSTSAGAGGDIVITSNGGAPLDQNVYQSVKGLTAAESAARPGATLIICAECADGIGGEGFFRALSEAKSASALLENIRATPQERTVPDQWQYQILARILEKHRVIFVTRPELREEITAMKMEYAPDADTAFCMAKSRYAAPKTVVIPDGVSVVIKHS